MANATGAKMALEKELETYQSKLPELKAQEGKYVLIQGDKVIDTFTSYEDAMKDVEVVNIVRLMTVRTRFIDELMERHLRVL